MRTIYAYVSENVLYEWQITATNRKEKRKGNNNSYNVTMRTFAMQMIAHMSV